MSTTRPDQKMDPSINRIYREKHEAMDDAISKIAFFEDNEPDDGYGEQEHEPTWGTIRFEKKGIHVSFSGYIPYRKRYIVTLISILMVLLNVASQYIEWLTHIRV